MKILLAKTRPYFARVEYEPQVFFKFLELDENNQYIIFHKDGAKILKRFGIENFPKNLIVTDCKSYYDTDKCSEKKDFLESFVVCSSLSLVLRLGKAQISFLRLEFHHLLPGYYLRFY